MSRVLAIMVASFVAASPAAADSAATLCTIVADRNGKVLFEEGPACGDRVTPASTFKVALAVMGFDAGVLKGPDDPVLPFKKGYPDWGGDAWRRPVGPKSWMHDSVVWYSQQIARRLTAERLTSYAKTLDYGNADFSGDPGKDNGLDRSWIGSSLKISPREQIGFIARLTAGRLPVSADAMKQSAALLDRHEAGGWTIRGKTGSAFPRKADGTLDRARGWGWYVGWAERGGQRLVVVRLRQDVRRETESGGIRSRTSVLRDWTGLVDQQAVSAALK